METLEESLTQETDKILADATAAVTKMLAATDLQKAADECENEIAIAILTEAVARVRKKRTIALVDILNQAVDAIRGL